MALLSVSKIRLSGIAASVPSQTVLNKELKGFSKKEKDLLIKTTGIHSRRIAPEHINASPIITGVGK